MSHTRSSTPGNGRPTVPPRRSPCAGAQGLDVSMTVSDMPYRSRMVWPVRCCHWLKVSSSKGAEPDMKRRIALHWRAVRPGSASSRTYIVGTPMNTVARGRLRTTQAGSKRDCHNMALPLISAPCRATNRPCT